MSQAKPLANTVYQVGVHQGVCKPHRLPAVKPERVFRKHQHLGTNLFAGQTAVSFEKRHR